MMKWYEVTKKIGGRSYLYRQRTYREGGRVRTQSLYVGPANDLAVSSDCQRSDAQQAFDRANKQDDKDPSNLVDVEGVRERVKLADEIDLDNWKPSNPFLANSNARPAEQPKNSVDAHSTQLVSFDVDNWVPSNPFLNREKPKLTIQTTKKNALPFGSRAISMMSFEAEYGRVAKQLNLIGFDGSKLAAIKLIEGQEQGWSGGHGKYKVYRAPTKQGSSGRNRFKHDYRIALSHSLLDGIETQCPEAFDAIRCAVDYSWVNTKLLVASRILSSNAKTRDQTNRVWVLMQFLWSCGLPASLEKQLGMNARSLRTSKRKRTKTTGLSSKKLTKRSSLSPRTWRDEAAELTADVIQRGYDASFTKHSKETKRTKSNANRNFAQYQKLTRLQRLSAKGRKKWETYKRHEVSYLIASQRQSRLEMLAPFLSNFHET